MVKTHPHLTTTIRLVGLLPLGISFRSFRGQPILHRFNFEK